MEEAIIMKVDVTRYLNCLKPRERLVTELRYGLDGNTPLTYREIGYHIGVSAARAHQICAKAQRRLRSLMRRDDFHMVVFNSFGGRQ